VRERFDEKGVLRSRKQPNNARKPKSKACQKKEELLVDYLREDRSEIEKESRD